jgi:acetate kinase
MNILVINCGSSSIKFQVIDTRTQLSSTNGIIENIGNNISHIEALQLILAQVQNLQIDAVGHRVVHGGDQFSNACIINQTVIEAIQKWSHIAPLHNPHNLSGITAAQSAFPHLPHIAVFDTAFHAKMPRRANTYAINAEIAHKHHIKRYGFHGTSHAYVAMQAANYLQRPLNELRLISLHLGNGASACAVEFGHSTETSMGMTPLEGLVMGTRSGDIDPGIIFLLAREENMPLSAIENMLNKQSGLLGLSGISHDLRDIEKAAAEGHDQARLAINVFAHHVRKYIGAYAAVMGGVDAILVTGGIGENSATMRQRILQRLDFLGLIFDEDQNTDARISPQQNIAVINSPHSRVQALVVKTNEELQIALECETLLQQQRHIKNVADIPVSISARHIHLNQETFTALFGKHATPTHYKDLMQPGQYACKETLTLIGPRGTIDNVRLLGPLRPANQVEISRTDEFHLGIDAPVRESGQTKGSAPITLQGPHGTVHLTEGLICARRHIHMSPADALRFGVSDKDVVEVAINSSERKLIFGDVLIRVHPNFVLEMHIDTDEANAAELNQCSDASLVYDTVHSTSANLQPRQ